MNDRHDDDGTDLLEAFRRAERFPAPMRNRIWERVERSIDRSASPPRRWATIPVVAMVAAVAAALVVGAIGSLMTRSAELEGVRSQAADRAQRRSSDGRTVEPSERTKHPIDESLAGVRQGEVSPETRPASSVEASPSSDVVIAPPAGAMPAATRETALAGSEDAEPRPREMPVNPGGGKAEALGKPAGGANSERIASESTDSSVPVYLGAELRLIEHARRALLDREPTKALQLLSKHAQRFPRGALTPERRALRAIATCQAHGASEGRALAKAVLRDHPRSALAPRLREACGIVAGDE